MSTKTAKANVEPVRQRTQYSCMAASMAMCLRALDHDVTEDEVNRVMGARPMKGAAWEQALATAQHYGCRATLTMPSTVEQLKAWTDAGVPVMIAWNPEGRPWSHASVVFDVDEELNVYVADPNIPNPKKTVRVVPEDEFYGKWYEKFPDYLVRRPACAISREVTTSGAQVAPFIARTASAVPSDAEKVPGTKFWVSKAPSKGPFRGQKDQFKIYNQHGGVVGGAPRREDAVATAKKMAAKVAYGVSVKRLNSGEVVVNAGPSYQRSAKMLLEKAGWDWRLVEDRAGSWIFPKGANVDEMMRALSELGPVRKAGQNKTAEPYDCYRDGLRGRELADCYKRFPDDLGPKDIAFIQQFYPGWSPGGGGYSRPSPRYDIQEAADKAILGLIYQGGQAKDIKFLWGVRTWALKGKGPTPKQQRWYDGLIKRTQSFASKIPGKVRLDTNPNGLVFLGRGSDSSTMKFVEDHFIQTGPFIEGPKPKNQPTPAPPPLEGAANQAQLDALDGLLALRPDRFIQSIRDQVARGRQLSEAQLKAVRQNFYRNRMRDKADLFRAAGLDMKNAKKGPRSVGKTQEQKREEQSKIKVEAPKPRNETQRAIAERGGLSGGGKHHNRDRDVAKGRSRKEKHKKRLYASIDRLSRAYLMAAYSGNPDGKPIYDVKVDHGEYQALSGGWDVMKRLQDRYRIEQGHPPRDGNPQLTNETAMQTKAAARMMVVDLYVDGRPRDSFQMPVAPKGIASYPEPMAEFGGQWWPLKSFGSPARTPWIDIPGAAARRMRLAATFPKARLSRQDRAGANRALVKAGLDGNGRFRKPEHAYSKALDVLTDFGIELDTIVSSHLFKARPTGVINVDLAYSNEEDPFSPFSITNSVLHLQFTELDKDRFEAVAYLS
jgi:hypothetical protein